MECTVTKCGDKGLIYRISGSMSPMALLEVLDFVKLHESQFERSMALVNGESVEHENRTSSNLVVMKDKNEMIDAILFDVFNRALTSYIKALSQFPVYITEDEGFNILKYEVGGKYNVHIDDIPTVVRRISGLLYLNDNYEGGELYFPAYDLKIKPLAGEIILFPSTFEYPHASLPVSRGIKLAVTTWFK